MSFEWNTHLTAQVDNKEKHCLAMYHEEFRKAEHCVLEKSLFLQKPISTDDLIKEVNKKINNRRL